MPRPSVVQTPDTTLTIFAGTDMQGDACLYAGRLDDAGNLAGYLTEEETEELAIAVQELIDAGKLGKL